MKFTILHDEKKNVLIHYNQSTKKYNYLQMVNEYDNGKFSKAKKIVYTKNRWGCVDDAVVLYEQKVSNVAQSEALFNDYMKQWRISSNLDFTSDMNMFLRTMKLKALQAKIKEAV